MKKLILSVLMLATALVCAVPAYAQGGDAEQYVSGDTSNAPSDASSGIAGTITSISGPVVLVEEDPSSDSGDKGYFTITDETEIVGPEGEPASEDTLEIGQRVEATYAGPVMESYPSQGDAARIVILGDGPPPEDEVTATGILERLEAEPVVVDGVEICGLSTHAITDEATGRYYDLTSDAVDLDAYVGERVALTGTLLASPAIEGAERCPDLDVTRVKVLDGTEPPPPGDSATFAFELAVECEPPAGVEFLGLTATESFVTTPLTDPDGDGVYTGSQTVPRFAPGGPPEPITISPVQIVQGPPTVTGPIGPEYRVIKDFGSVADEDTTLSASVFFCGGGSDDGDGGKGGTVVVGDTNDYDGGGTLGGITTLPATGGIPLIAGLAGLVIVAGGLVVRRISR